jgi:DNA-binding beta-propeller fold protein YncE
VRLRRIGIVCSATFALCASSAQAAGYSPIGKFGAAGSGYGQLEAPAGVAVEAATGDVFVVDQGNSRVQKLGPEGQPLPGEPVISGAATPAKTFGGEAFGVAVDDSAGPTKGDVYIADGEQKVVYRFKPTAPGSNEYRYECELTGLSGGCTAAGATPTAPFEEPRGIAVDSQGDVYVAAFGPVVYEFQPSGANLGPGELTSPLIVGAWSVAPDGKGHLYLTNLNENTVKLTVGPSGEVTGEETLDSNGSREVAVDPTSEDVFVVDAAGANRVSEYSAAGTLIEEFGREELPAKPEFGPRSNGIAVSPLNGDVYVTSKAHDEVIFYAKAEVPVVLTESPVEVQPTSATLAGTLTPNGEAHWFFEYGETTSYGTVVGPEGPLSGPLAIPVAAHVEDLVPNTTYHYRLGAYNVQDASSPVKGADVEFLTPAIPPVISAETASALDPRSMALDATIEPEHSATTYRFEYVEVAHYCEACADPYEYGEGVLAAPVEGEASAGSGVGSVTVSQQLEELTPNTTYDYRVIATNQAGSEAGANQRFTTEPPLLPQVSTEPAVDVTQTTATLTGTIDTRGMRTNYGFAIGTAPGEETTVLLAEAPEGAGPELVTFTVRGLAPNTTYHYRLVGSDIDGSSDANETSFTTLEVPGSYLLAPPTPTLVPVPQIMFPAPHEIVKPKPKSKRKRTRRRSRRRA